MWTSNCLRNADEVMQRLERQIQREENRFSMKMGKQYNDDDDDDDDKAKYCTKTAYKFEFRWKICLEK